jgi:hypothetical protein
MVPQPKAQTMLEPPLLVTPNKTPLLPWIRRVSGPALSALNASNQRVVFGDKSIVKNRELHHLKTNF